MRVQQQRQPDEFCAAHSGGGGFLKFDGEYKPWSWIRRNCVCAVCGISFSRVKSSVGCYGFFRGATYFQCDGPDHHLITRTADVTWRVSRKAKDEELRPGELKAVQEAYPWVFAKPSEEVIDW